MSVARAAWASLVVASLAACQVVLGIDEGHERPAPVALGGAAGTAGASVAGASGVGGGAGASGAAGGSGGASGAAAGGAGAAGDAGAAGVAGVAGGAVAVPMLVHKQQLGSTANDTASDICSDADDALYAAGKLGGMIDFGGVAASPEPSGETRYLVKYDEAGKLAWVRRLAGSVVTINQLFAAKGGGVYVIGTATGEARVLDAPLATSFTPPPNTSPGAFALKLASNGAALWMRRFDGEKGRAITGRSAAERDDELVLAGVFGGALSLDGVSLSSAADDDVYLARLDPLTGAVKAARSIGSPGDDAYPQLVARADGFALAMTCAGQLSDIAPAVDCLGVAFVDLDGALGARRVATIAADVPTQLVFVAVPSGETYLAARFSGQASPTPLAPLAPGANRTFVARLATDFTPLAATLLPSPGASVASALAVDVDGGVLVGGWLKGCVTASGFTGCTAPSGSQNAFTMKLSPDLAIQWFGLQLANAASTNGVTTSLSVTPKGALLGAANFSDKVLVGGTYSTAVGGVDGLVGRFDY